MRTIRRIIRHIKAAMFKFTGPISTGDKFVTLDEEYVNKFDEIVVIGDIHGCYDEFKEMLNKIHSETTSRNPDKCLKILTGDLVNKGPKSQKVLEMCRILYPDSIISVRGNHDEIVMGRYKQYKETGVKPDERNKWIEKLPQKYVDYLNLLPFSIIIPSLKSIIVHGGINPSLEDPARTTPTELMTTMRNIEVLKNERTNETSYKCTKSTAEGIAWATFWPGPEHVYFGHDAKRRLQDDHEFATGLDTGCVYGGSLTGIFIKGPRKGKMISIEAKQVYEAVVDKE